MEWMDLPGPKRFVERVIERRNASSIVGLRLPCGIGWLRDAVAQALDREIRRHDGTGADLIRIGPGETRSPAHIIGARGGGRVRIRMTEDILSIPELMARTFIVQGTTTDDWRRWLLFLGQLRRFCARIEGARPNVILFLPGGVPPEEEREAFGRDGVSVWHGVIGQADTVVWAHQKGFSPQGICEHLALETSIELAGWNRDLLDFLLDQDEDIQIDPRDDLKAPAGAAVGSRDACWEDGHVDIWEGWPRIDTLALLAANRDEEVRKRIWRAHSRVLFPVIDEIRCALIRRHFARIEPCFRNGGFWKRERKVGFPEPKPRMNPFQLEINELRLITDYALTKGESDLIGVILTVRHKMAHMEPAEVREVRVLEDLWMKLENDVPQVELGWDWPRCGQSLTIMVGPSGAGKSTWARRHHPAESIVSSDNIREETGNHLDHDWIFAEVGRRVKRLLASGRGAVVDAMHLRPHERAASRNLAPKWVPVRYIVIDRPLADKIRDGGWRNAPEKNGMIKENARRFLSNIEDILSGDGIDGVEVVNLIEGDVEMEQNMISATNV